MWKKILVFGIICMTVLTILNYRNINIHSSNRTSRILTLQRKINFLYEDIDLLQKNEFFMIKSEYAKINPNFQITTLDNNKKKIKDITGSGKLVFYFSEKYCSLCYKTIIKKINHYSDSTRTQNIIVLAEFENLRNFHFFLKDTKIKIPIYYTQKQLNIKATEAKQPFFFVLDKAYEAKYLFIPDKKYDKYIEDYLSFIDGLYVNKGMDL